jgi:UDP-glucose 4-epimerase
LPPVEETPARRIRHLTIVITGATGMIGSQLCASLLSAGRPVRILSRTSGGDAVVAHSRPLPAPDAPAGAFEAALAGASHVVHCAALNSDAGGAGKDDFLAANATLTAKLAEAASRMVPGRFIFLSSTRAMVDALETATLDEEATCRPSSAYGLSKLEGERLLAAAYDRAGRSGAVTLRLPPVYGEGMRGQLGALFRLADTPLPLPFKTYGAPRTLLSSRTLAQAITLLLDHGGPTEALYLVGDRDSVSVGDIICAFRTGLDRPARLFALPEPALRMAAALARQARTVRLLAAGQTVVPDRLAALGWAPEPDTAAALARLTARISRQRGQASRS